jgi:hypothetical protein
MADRRKKSATICGAPFARGNPTDPPLLDFPSHGTSPPPPNVPSSYRPPEPARPHSLAAPGSNADARHRRSALGVLHSGRAARSVWARTFRKATRHRAPARLLGRGNRRRNFIRAARHTLTATGPTSRPNGLEPQGIANVSRRVSRKRKSRLSSASGFRQFSYGRGERI